MSISTKISAKDQMIASLDRLYAQGIISESVYNEQKSLLTQVEKQAKTSEVWDQAAYGVKPFAKSGYSYKGLEWFDMPENDRPKYCYFAVYYNKQLLVEWYSDQNFNGIYRQNEQGLMVLHSFKTVIKTRSESRDAFTNSDKNTKGVCDPWHFERCNIYEIALKQRKYNNGEKGGVDFWAQIESEYTSLPGGKPIVMVKAEALKAEAPKAEAPKAEAPKAEPKASKKGK